MSVLNYKCLSCGAPVTFDSLSQEMGCNSCGAHYQVADLLAYNEEESRQQSTSQTQWDSYQGETLHEDTAESICPSCGAQIIADPTTTATQCPYCDNTIVLSRKVDGTLRPDLIIPFQMDKTQALDAVAKFYKGKILLPRAFAKQHQMEKITGVYVPVWLYDCGTQSHYTYDAKKIHNWSDSNYNYTRTDHYMLVREGEHKFACIPVCGLGKMSDEYMEALEPFDFTKAVDFQTAYLSGYLADKYDLTSEKCQPRVNQRIQETLDTLFQETTTGYSSITTRAQTTSIEAGHIRYALLPVWMLNTKYKGQTYTFAMNGQTGELVGKLPVDNGRYWGLVAAVFAGVMMAGSLFTALMTMGG